MKSQRPGSVVVIGGGVVGRACALQLLARGAAVTLVDEARRTPPASWGNAGHIATEFVVPLATFETLLSVPRQLFPKGPVDIDWSRLRIWLPWSAHFLRACLPDRVKPGTRALRALMADALPAWYRLAADLGQAEWLTGRGIIKLWETPGSARAGYAEYDSTDLGTATLRRLPEAELACIQSAVSIPIAAGLQFENTEQVTDIGGMLAAMKARFIERGGVWRDDPATRITAQGGRPEILLRTGDLLRPDQALIASGVASRHLLQGLRVYEPLIAERGYHIEWDHGGAWHQPNLIFEDRALCVSRFGARMRATSFVEFTERDAPLDARKWEALERHVVALGLPVASPFVRWAGSRPTLPDYLPALGAIPGAPGVFGAYGHQHLGLTLSARSAELMAAIMTGEKPALAMAPFRPGRWSRKRSKAISV